MGTLCLPSQCHPGSLCRETATVAVGKMALPGCVSPDTEDKHPLLLQIETAVLSPLYFYRKHHSCLIGTAFWGRWHLGHLGDLGLKSQSDVLSTALAPPPRKQCLCGQLPPSPPIPAPSRTPPTPGVSPTGRPSAHPPLQRQSQEWDLLSGSEVRGCVLDTQCIPMWQTSVLLTHISAVLRQSVFSRVSGKGVSSYPQL